MTAPSYRWVTRAIDALAARRCLLLALLGIFLACVALRAFVLFGYPYPPSGDVAGDLYEAHAWLGHPLPGLSSYPLQPPLYYFLVVIPFTAALPVFLATRLYMSIIPALLVFPGYLLCREVGASKNMSLLGSALFGTASAFSLMLTWNAAFNLFGIFFLMFFLAFLVHHFRKPSLKTMVLVGAFFGLVVGTHPLSALVAGLTLLIGLGLWSALGLVRQGRGFLRRRLIEGGLLLFTCASAAAPFAWIYYQELGVTVVSGPSQLQFYIGWTFQVALYFGWGFQGVTFIPLAIIDIAASAVAFTWLIRESVAVSSMFVGLSGALALLVFVEPANAVRLVYFGTILMVVGVPLLLDKLRQFLDYASKPASSPRHRRRHKQAMIATVASLAVAFLVLNCAYSYQLLEEATLYNQSLTPADVHAMNWVDRNTPSNATFFDAAGLQTWLWGYANRMDYQPGDLTNQVTVQSYQATLDANLIALGKYVIGNGYWAIAYSLPSPEDSPKIYVSEPSGWELFMGSQSSQTSFEVTNGSGFMQNLHLQYATLLGVSYSLGAGSVMAKFTLWWAVEQQAITLEAFIRGESLGLSWTSNSSSIQAVNLQFGIPPSGYNFNYVSVPPATNVRSISDTFSLLGSQFSTSISGGLTNQSSVNGGWTLISFEARNFLSVNGSGMMAYQTQTPFFTNASTLYSKLGIGYSIVNMETQFAYYDRMRANFGQSDGYDHTLLFKTGDIYIYLLTPCSIC